MNGDMLDFIKSRRSTRKFKPQMVEREKIQQILEAGQYAPSGGNNQSTHFLVVTSEKVKDQLAVLAEAAFAKMEITPDTYASMANSIRASKKGGYVFHYHCPCLILCANQKNYSNNIADVSCTLENMMLMANALDLGSVWINQLKWLNEDPEIVALLQSLGMGEEERIYGGLAIGYADTEDGMPNRNPLPRKGNAITWIEDAEEEQEAAATDLSALNLTYKTEQCLRNAGITTVEELNKKTVEELFTVPMLGRRGISEVLSKR